MMARAWVTLRQHRFEVGFATLAALAAAALGVWIRLQIDALHVTQDCLDRVSASQDGSGIDEKCLTLVRSGSEILGGSYIGGGGTLQLSIMGALPFIVGLLGGLPVVARELEERTAQTAWWLEPSRIRWLVRQILPIGLLLGAAMGIAAGVATPVAEDWVRWGQGGASELIGLYGVLALLRAFAAFGIGLAVGALLGRTLSGFVFSVALIIAVLLVVGQARDSWISRQPLDLLATHSAQTGEWNAIPGEVRSSGWIDPSGRLLTLAEARQVARDAGVPPPKPEDLQDTAAGVWLAQNGYTEVPLGVSDQTAMGWAPFDGLIFGGLGCAALAGAFVVVQRRRP